jgi:autotransporter-associated beta strand protein
MTIAFAAGATNSTGILTLSGNNSSYSGNINIPGGTVTPAVSSNDELGTGLITLSGGTLALQGQVNPNGNWQAYNNDLSATANSNISVTGTLNAYMRNLSFGTATLTVSSTDTTGNPYILNFLSTTPNGSPTFNILNSTGGGHGTVNLYAGSGYPSGVGIGNSSSAALIAHLFQAFTVTNGTVAFPAHPSGQLPDVTVVTSLTLTGAGTVDLGNNDLVVRNGSLASITSMLKSGYNGASAGIWKGVGVDSSSAATDSLTALGVLLNSTGSGTPIYTSFDGQSVGSSDVLVKYTYYGDADLSGAVDGSDYSRIDNGAISNGTLTGWQNGDFNYDGVINGSDYTLIDNAYNTQGANIAVVVVNPTAEIASQNISASVPEPANSGIMAAATLGLLARRRRLEKE